MGGGEQGTGRQIFQYNNARRFAHLIVTHGCKLIIIIILPTTTNTYIHTRRSFICARSCKLAATRFLFHTPKDTDRTLAHREGEGGEQREWNYYSFIEDNSIDNEFLKFCAASLEWKWIEQPRGVVWYGRLKANACAVRINKNTFAIIIMLDVYYYYYY